MLYITDSDGYRQTGIVIEQKELSGESGSVVTLAARIYENDTALAGQYVSAVLSWNDGSGEVLSFPATPLATTAGGYLAISVSKRLLPGYYACGLRAQNYRSPIEDATLMSFLVRVVAAKPVYNPPSLVFGPILPRDAGFPNASQWTFNLDYDLVILESSVKMLLLTTKGDRVMLPEYGTNIRRVLFDMNIRSTEGILREEIVAAFAQWEPRVELAGLSVELLPNDRTASLSVTLVSKLTRQSFETTVSYSR